MKLAPYLTRSLAIAGLATFAALPVHALTVTPSGSGTTLANTILGGGVSLVGTPTLTGGNLGNSASSAALFSGGVAAGIGIESGILLTSGNASLANGTTNDADNSTGSNGNGGNALLSGLVGGAQTLDATVLTFDFTTASGDLFFNFVFASEEYNEFTNSQFNDVFGFFVDGVNIALLPGTSTPISINNVNGGNPLGVNSSNSQYFNNNDFSDGSSFPFEYDGFTDVFTVQALGLAAGTHTITLAIADLGDTSLDSGVFIQAGTFSSTPTPTGVPDAASSLLLSVMGLAGLVGFKRFASRRAAA